MSQAYVKPGVTIDEVVSPSFSPLLAEPTSICIIGPSRGYESHVEVVLLSDNEPYELTADNADVSSIEVVDAGNINSTPFLPDEPVLKKDYSIDSSTLALDGKVKLARSMQTDIPNGERVAAYYENSGAPVQADGKSDILTLTRTLTSQFLQATVNTQAASIKVMSGGNLPVAEIEISGSGGATPTIAKGAGAAVVGKFQRVWVTFDIGTDTYIDQPVQLNDTTPVALPANADNIRVYTVNDLTDAEAGVDAILYTKGTTTDEDYIVDGSGATTGIHRSAGTTTIGAIADALAVRISYRATPSEYFLATRCFSQGDVEDKYGAAFDSDGNINSAVSFAAGLAFANGATDVVIQALFEDGTPPGSPTGVLSDWQSTLEALRDIEDVNVLVPLLSAPSMDSTDAGNLAILTAIQDHVTYMATKDQFLVTIAGEDSTVANQATQDTLRAHAEALGARNSAEAMVLLAPGSYQYPNPITGQVMNIGGQYVAAGIAGLLAAYSIQDTLTRKQLVGISGINELRSEANKDADGDAGLMVIENTRGRIWIRHAITTDRSSTNASELSVVRAKHNMMESIRDTLDTQVIGQIIADQNAPFTVQLIVSSVLETLANDGVIVSYQDVQARQLSSNPTLIEVRFSYLPAYPLNYIQVKFSIDTVSGTFVAAQETEGV